MKRHVLSGVLLALALTACTKTEKVIERLPPENIAESMSVSAQGAVITLKKSSLEKAFLLMATSKQLNKTPDWKDHVAQIVSFERFGNKVGLYDLGKDQIYDNIRAARLLQSFPIVKETETELQVDLGQGFKSIDFEDSLEIFAPEYADYFMKEMGAKPKIQIIDGVVRTQKIEDNRLKIVQDSRLRTSKLEKTNTKYENLPVQQAMVDYEYSVQTHYELIPYKENPNFKAKPLDPLLQIGYFVKEGHLKETTKSVRNTVRWDVSDEKGPIRYILAKEFPESHLSEIEEGLLYWNRVFGKKIIVIEKSQDRDLLPQDRAVLVRYVNWKDASFAYAGIQTDPLTGEILRGQIFLPSSWFNNDNQAQAEELAKLENIPGEMGTYEKMKRLGLIQTVAHEAGHVFGLRHNFAASSALKIPLKKLNDTMEAYRKGSMSDAFETSTSVMDYQFGLDGAIVSQWMRSNVLAYDRAAIEWGYEDKSPSKEAIGDFCSDDHLMMTKGVAVLGCAQGDAPGNRVVSEFLKLRNQFKTTSVGYAVKYLVGVMYPASGGRQSLLGTNLYAPEYSTQDMMGLFFTKTRGDKTIPLLYSRQAMTETIKNKMSSPLSSNSEIYDSYLSSEMQALLSAAKEDEMFKSAVTLKGSDGQMDWDWLFEELNSVLASPASRSGTLNDGRKFSVTEQDAQEIREFLLSRTALFKKAFLMSYVKALSPIEMQFETDPDTKKQVSFSTAYASQASSLGLIELAGQAVVEVLRMKQDQPESVGMVLGQPWMVQKNVVIYSSEIDTLLKLLRKNDSKAEEKIAPIALAYHESLNTLAKVLGGTDSMTIEQKMELFYRAYVERRMEYSVYAWATGQKAVIDSFQKK